MLKVAIFAAVVALALPAYGQTPYHRYDPWSGNSYTVHPDRQGATIYGNNPVTGTMWTQRQNRDGSYNGTDSEGNLYFGNNRTGTYMNSDGTTCIGTGALRTCQ